MEHSESMEHSEQARQSMAQMAESTAASVLARAQDVVRRGTTMLEGAEPVCAEPVQALLDTLVSVGEDAERMRLEQKLANLEKTIDSMSTGEGGDVGAGNSDAVQMISRRMLHTMRSFYNQIYDIPESAATG